MLIGPVTLVGLSMSHYIKDNKIYKSSSIAHIGSFKDGKIYKSSSIHVIGSVKDGKIYKSSSIAVLNINSTIHSAIKDSKNYDLALMAAAYHFLIKPIF